ncbi:MAG: hypothetical protein WC957_02295 [Candidatus Neomarinimicrobiota bacterium]|jgi:hypothetical protein
MKKKKEKEKRRIECPLGGDERNNCEGCIYNGDYYFNEKTKECELRKN